MKQLLAVLLAAASCASAAQAQTLSSAEAGQTLSLRQALELAGAVSPALEAASADIASASAGQRVAALRPNPNLGIDMENVAGTGDYRAVKSLETTASFAVPIELGGKRSARISAARALMDRTQIQAAIAAADLKLGVIRSYTEVIAAHRHVDIAQEQVRISIEALRAAQIRVQAGRASPIEVERANVVRITAEAGSERAERIRQVAALGLAQLIGQPVPAVLDLEWFSQIDTIYGPLSSVDSSSTLAMAAANADLAIADAGVRMAHAQRVPDLTLNAGARRFEASKDTAAVFGLSVPLPLFNKGSAALDQASADRRHVHAKLRATALDVERAIVQAQADAANAATSAFTANGPAFAAAEEAARIARIGYREGKFGQLDLLDAERMLAATRVNAIDALSAYHIAQAQLERLIARAPTRQGE